MDVIEELTKLVIKFRNDRDWEQFHNPKDLAISLSLEASEVLEHFQWKTKQEIEEYLVTHKEEISDEIADVLYYLLTLSYDLGIDIRQALLNKTRKSEKKYPVAKSKGKHTKYTDL